MTDRPGMTCSPIPTENQDGTVSYDFEVDDGKSRVSAIEDFHRNQDNYGLYDAQGNLVHHQYFPTEADEQLQLEQEFGREAKASDFYTDQLSEADEDAIFEAAGGEENFANALQWAKDNLPEELMSQVISAYSTGDVEALLTITSKLSEMYEENKVEVTDVPADYPDEEIDAVASEAHSVAMQIAGSEENYDLMTQYASENWSEEEINQFDAIIDNGSTDDIQTAVSYLKNRYLTHNQ